MNNATIGAALLGGYVLGRTKKGKLAVTAATWMLRKKINPKEIASAVTGSPAMDALGERIRKELVTAGKEAATTAVAARADRLADSLHSRTAGLREDLPPLKGEKGGKDEDRAAGEEQEDEQEGRDEQEDEGRDEQEDRGGKKDREQRQDGADDEGGEPGAEEEQRPKPRKRSAKAGSERPRRTSGDKEGGAARQKKSSGTARRSGA
ncbi:hypothetical protein [Streptomyces lavendulocolor]|uniref:hypothetical protein n=1 Tax=Streptomyces lavendulocolor TaxID=67316 RepID=UPI003C2C5656